MKTRILVIPALVVLAATVWAAPISLYRVELAPGINAYRYAGNHSWPIYYSQGNVALVGKSIRKEGYPEVVTSTLVYSGPSEKLKWVGRQKGNKYSYNGMVLLKFSDVVLVEDNGNGQMIKAITEGFRVLPFTAQPIVVKPELSVVNPFLTKDTLINAMVQNITVANFQTTVETLQAFPNRNANGPYNDSAAAWLLSKFQSFGITDVKLDTFTFQSWYIENDTYKFRTDTCHNVIATIPGTQDTSPVYVVGGHYDTSVWLPGDTLGIRGPGADDNGSGTAAAIEMARIFVSPPPLRTLKFIAFDCEEWGLYGSAKAANDAYNAGSQIGCMLNYDMIGSNRNDSIFVSKTYPGSEQYAHMLGQAAQWYGRTNDTNLVVSYNDVYLSGSDSWEYYNYGYNVTYSEEYYFSDHYHMVSDSTVYMNMRYATSIVRAGAGMLSTLSNYPLPVKGIVCTDAGTGDKLLIEWQEDFSSNITGYKIYWGSTSGNYSGSKMVTVNIDTLGPLTADAICFIGVVAIDDQGRESPIITEVTGTPRAVPQAPSGLMAMPVDLGITLSWKKNLELDLAGYEVYRSINGGAYDSLASPADSFWLDKPLSGSNKYYYKVLARDTDGNKGTLSDSVYSRPITLDQGILLVDETNNWTTGSFPRDAQQDTFYNNMLYCFQTTPYEYGTSSQKPLLADFGPYSTVVWMADDYITLLASGAVNDLKRYLDHGGKLWCAGWKPSGDVRGAATYPADFAAGSLMYDCFKVSHAELSGTADSFQTAVGLNGYPSISVDPAKYPASTWGGVFRNVEALTPTGTGDTIYVMDMKNNGSIYEGRACAVRDSGKVVFFGFPMYFMDREQAKLAAERVMAEFGEEPLGVTEGKDNREQMARDLLWQNNPNPFSQTTIIRYQISKAGKASLKVYNIQGQLVKILDEGYRIPGEYSARWNGKDESGILAANGVYLYRLESPGKSMCAKMILLK
jgi:hypothetical protein